MSKELESNRTEKNRLLLILVFGFLAIVLALGFVQTLLAQAGDDPDQEFEEETVVYHVSSAKDLEKLPEHIQEYYEQQGFFENQSGADLGSSTINVDKDEAYPGAELAYSIVISNTGDVDVNLSMVDDLPTDLEYVSHIFHLPVGGLQTGGGVFGQTITWEGTIAASGYVEIDVVAKIKNDAVVGTEINNIIDIVPNDSELDPLQRMASTRVIESIFNQWLNLPYVVYQDPPPTPEIDSIKATILNQAINSWVISWTSADTAVSYELQQATYPDFRDAQTYYIYPVAHEMTFNQNPSPNNEYHYRVRSKAGKLVGPWSETVNVIGGYLDEFANPATGWDLRRSSYLEEVRNWYEIEPNKDKSWHILQVEDRWDMGISSPMRQAPEVPYVIEVNVADAHPGWQKGYGIVFGADYPASSCPGVETVVTWDKETAEAWYDHKLCFNQFYEVMFVDRAGDKDLQVQRIHEVNWIPGTGGIPLHRAVAESWYIEKISGVSWEDFNLIRIVVTENNVQVYTGRSGSEPKLKVTLGENMYPTHRYFGTIATTQEYSNVTARYENYRVLPSGN